MAEQNKPHLRAIRKRPDAAVRAAAAAASLHRPPADASMASMVRRLSASLLAAMALATAATFAGWSLVNERVDPPPMPTPLSGVAYAPWGKHDDPLHCASRWRSIARHLLQIQQREMWCDALPVDAQAIDRDLSILAPHVRRLRTYKAVDGEIVLTAAARHGLSIVAGAQIDDRRENTQREIAALIELTKMHANIESVIVGSETNLRYDPNAHRRGEIHGGLPIHDLVRHIRHVKRNVTAPVSTAEPPYVWLTRPELAAAVDFITVQLWPYWEHASIEHPLAYVRGQVDQLRRAYPGKAIVVGEIGWPSAASARSAYQTVEGASGFVIRRSIKRANPAAQVGALREVAAWLASEKIDYFLPAAFDQPWKQFDLEGMAGAYMGLWDADRKPKWSWTGPVDSVPHWPALTAITCLLCLPVLWALCGVVAGWAGRVALAGVVPFSGGVAVWAAYEASTLYLTLESAVAAGAGVALPLASLAFLYVALRRLRSA